MCSLVNFRSVRFLIRAADNSKPVLRSTDHRLERGLRAAHRIVPQVTLRHLRETSERPSSFDRPARRVKKTDSYSLGIS